MREFFKNYSPSSDSFAIIRMANEIVDEYTRLGLTLTLRQLYYRFIAQDYFPIDWDAMEDRGRNLYGFTHRSSPRTHGSSMHSTPSSCNA